MLKSPDTEPHRFKTVCFLGYHGIAQHSLIIDKWTPPFWTAA